jgi:hypothetical protein
MDNELLLSIAILAGLFVATAFERRAKAARASGGRGGTGSNLRLGESTIKAFTDHDRDVHPFGEEWTFLRSVFVPYHSGMSWFVSFDNVGETHIRLQGIPQEQGEVLDNLAEYLVAV